MPKQILFSDEGRAALLRGVNVMAAAVKATMGPKGRNVVIDGQEYLIMKEDDVLAIIE